MTKVNFGRRGIWARLFPKALRLMSSVEAQIPGAHWTFGGGTVLMLRFDHRESKDIDLFVPDPQYLGYVSPRLSSVAESISANYEESTDAVKIYCAEGEIDIVVGAPLTRPPFEVCAFKKRMIKVETTAEILAKKMWHRGDRATARDLFDLCAIADFEPVALEEAGPFIARHGAEFLRQLEQRRDYLSVQFSEIDARGFHRSYDECLNQAQSLIRPLLGLQQSAKGTIPDLPDP